MLNPYRTEAFKKLHSKWMQKLKKSDFEDLENERGEFKDCKATNLSRKQRLEIANGLHEIKIAYYSWASEMVHRGKFKSGKDRKIWVLHADGKTCSEISKETGLERSWISRKILKIAKYLKST